MGKVNLKRQLNCFHMIKIILTVLLFCYCLFLLLNTELPKRLALHARVQFSQLVTALEEGDIKKLNDYKAVYTANDGTVIKSTLKEYKEGQKINLHQFSSADFTAYHKGLHFFQSPVIIEGAQKGTVVAAYSYDFQYLLNHMGISLLLPIILLFAGIAVTIFYERKLVFQDILNPAKELTSATKKILNQDYETKITYEYSGVMSELCHDLEALRDELYYTRKNEEKMKRSEKELLASISHDLKTPLSSISGYVEGLKNQVVKTPEEVNSYLDIVMKKVQFMSKLMDDILEHSKTELHEFSVCPEEVYAEELFLEILTDLSIDLNRNGFIFTYDPVPKVMIYADKHRISQALHNITENSMKYTERNGSVHIGFQLLDKELIVSVKDTGSGISVGDLPFIFDKFYRGDKARTLNVPGSGLGLSITKYIIEQHEGKIECDSVLHEGTTIRFSFMLV